MRNRLRGTKVLDIVLSEEKFYFPGDTIQGAVIVKPKSNIKVNSILIKFSGAIYFQEKEVISLFQLRKSIPLPNDKSKVLEPRDYRFRFEFDVPENLPSAMDLDKKKLVRIEYKLEAILDRPMVPESLCPQIVYPVLIMECIDVTKELYIKPLEQKKDTLFPKINRCNIRLSLPRTGYTRGETIPVNVIVNTSQKFVCKEAIVIDLVRKVEMHTAKNNLKEEHVLKSEKLDLNIIGPYNFSQSITTQLLIRTTPPSLQYREKTLSVQYIIRARFYAKSSGTKPICVMELPIVIGTWPRAAVPIDEDDEDIIQYQGELMVGDEIDDDGGAKNDDEGDDDNHNDDNNSNHSLQCMMEQHRAELDLELKRGPYLTQPIRRTGSNTSLRSTHSWIPQAKLDHRLSTPIPDAYFMNNNNTPIQYHHSITPFHSSHSPPPPMPQNSVRLPTEYLNRSSSTPDLFGNPVIPSQQQSTRLIDPTTYYDHSPQSVMSMPLPASSRTSYLPGHRSSTSSHSMQLAHSPQQHRRVGSDGLVYVAPPEVPNHILTFIAGTQQAAQPQIAEDSDLSSLSDSDEDDLLAIVQRKQRTKEKRKRQQTQSFAAVA